MKIEIATESDVEELNNLLNICYRGKEAATNGWTHDVGLIDGTRSTSEGVLVQIQQPNGTIFKCSDDETGEMIASSMATLRGEKVHVGIVCVLPHLQGQGLGKKMMEAVEDHGRKLNCTTAIMEVVSAKRALIGWYERLGYKQTGNTYPFPDIYGTPKVPMVLVEMEKALV